MLSTSERLLRVLTLLESRREWSGADLAERLEVSTRTIRNDMVRLRTLGYPVGAASGVAGGYRLGAGAALPPLLLDDDEAVAVAVALRSSTGGGVAGIEETSVRALVKLEQVLPARLRRRVNTLSAYTVPVVFSGPTVEPHILSTIAAACRDAEVLRMDYRKHDGTESTRSVEPYRLVHWGRRWYLVAWDRDRRAWRTFRVDRLQLRSPNGPRFTPREAPAEDIGEYVTRNVLSNVLGRRLAWCETRAVRTAELETVDAEGAPRPPVSVPGHQVPPAAPVDQPVRLDRPRALRAGVFSIVHAQHLGVATCGGDRRENVRLDGGS